MTSQKTIAALKDMLALCNGCIGDKAIDPEKILSHLTENAPAYKQALTAAIRALSPRAAS
jgi:hypothetical protein